MHDLKNVHNRKPHPCYETSSVNWTAITRLKENDLCIEQPSLNTSHASLYCVNLSPHMLKKTEHPKRWEG